VISAALPFGVGLDEVFLPQYLKEQDYQTHAIGKVIKVYIVVTVPFAGLHLIADCGVLYRYMYSSQHCHSLLTVCKSVHSNLVLRVVGTRFILCVLEQRLIKHDL